jgi:hypothetical protein
MSYRQISREARREPFFLQPAFFSRSTARLLCICAWNFGSGDFSNTDRSRTERN